MLISRDQDGYISAYATLEQLLSGQVVGILKDIEEVPDFPPDQTAAWEHFKENYQAYTFSAVPPSYWDKTFGEGYQIPSTDIVAQFVYHPERAEAVLEVKRNEIRARREVECFPIINRGEAWYTLLTQEQKDELAVWYQAWLDAPQTLVIPENPEWLK